MKRNDIIIWYRFYVWDGESVDKMFEPLTYSSHRDFVDAFNEAWTEYNGQHQDYDIVDYEYIDERAAFQIYDDSKIWDSYNNIFDLSKEYGISVDTLFAVAGYWSIEVLEDVMENAYEGEYDYPSMRNFAYYIVEEELLNEDHYEWYFDYAHFGRELKWDYSLEMLVEEYDYSVSEAEELMDMRDDEFAEWYIEGIGDVSDLGVETIKTYFDYAKLERNLEAEGYLEINGHIFRPY